MQLAAPGDAGFPAQDGAAAFDQHQPAHRAEKHDVEPGDQKIDLADLPQRREHPNPDAGTDEAAGNQNCPHLEIDVAPPRVGQHAGDRCCDDLVGLGADRHRRRYADEDEQWRHQESAADAEQPGQEPDPATHRQKEEHVHRHLSNRQVNTHQRTSFAARPGQYGFNDTNDLTGTGWDAMNIVLGCAAL